MKEELRLFLVCLWFFKVGQCSTMDTTTDLLSLGWKGPKTDWVDYFNSTKDIRNKAGRYPDLPYDLLDRIPTGFGIWGLLHNDIGHGWAQDPNSFYIPTSTWVNNTRNIHFRFFLHGNAFIEVVADNTVEGMITVDNPCGNSCRPKFRESILELTNATWFSPVTIIVRMNTTNTTDVVLIDSITLDFEGDVEDEDNNDDECDCKLTTQSGTTEPSESSASEDECLSTLDNLSDDSWTSPTEFYFQNISEVIAADVVAESNLAEIADKQGIWAFAGNANSNSIRAEFSHNSSQTYYESVKITAILGGNGSIVDLDLTPSDLYTITAELEGDDGWWTFIIDFHLMSTVQIVVSVTEKDDFVLLDKIIAYGRGYEVTGIAEVTPPMCECTTLSSTSVFTTKSTATTKEADTTPSATTKEVETTKGQSISNRTLDTLADLLSLGWRGPRPDWVDYFNSTKDIRNKADRYPHLPYDLLDQIVSGLGIWGLLHNDVPHGWAQDPNSFQIPTYSLTNPTENIYLRFFLHGGAFIQVVAENQVDGMITVGNPCGNSCRPKFRERIIKFTSDPGRNITIRMNTTHISDLVLVDAITLNYIGEVEEDCYNDESECKLSTQSDSDLSESTTFGEESLSTLDDECDDDWTEDTTPSTTTKNMTPSTSTKDTTLSTTAKDTISSTTTEEAETTMTTTEIAVPEESSLSTSSEPSNTNVTSTKPIAETTSPAEASLLRPFILLAIIPLISQNLLQAW